MKPLPPSFIPRKNPHDSGAATLATEVLTYLAGDTDRLVRFFDLTGLTPQSLRHAAGQPGFTTNLLDYLASDERLLLAFSAESGRDPAEIDRLRQSLAPPLEDGDPW